MYKKHIVLIIISIIVPALQICAQTINTEAKASTGDTLSIENVELMNIELPPLQKLLETAINAPTVEMYRALKKENEGRLSLIKNEWMNHVRGVLNYSYGSMGSMTETSASGQSTYFQYFGEQMSLYNIGATISLPVDLFLNRKNKLNVYKSLVEQSDYKILEALEQRKMLIVENYSMAIQNLELLRVSQDALSIAKANVKLGEFEYINGSMVLDGLNELRREETVALSTHQEAKTALTIAILKLELLTNIKIIK